MHNKPAPVQIHLTLPRSQLAAPSIPSCVTPPAACPPLCSSELDGSRRHPSQEKGFSEAQKAIADGQGSQCGFCTPGWVVAMEAMLARSAVAGAARYQSNSREDHVPPPHIPAPLVPPPHIPAPLIPPPLMVERARCRVRTHRMQHTLSGPHPCHALLPDGPG